MTSQRGNVALICVAFLVCALGGYDVATHRWPHAILSAAYCLVAGVWLLRRVRRADELESWVTRREEHTQ